MSEMIAKTTFSSDTQAKEYIYACEAAFRARIDHIADCILAQKSVRLLGLGGPTCAGKSTAAKLLIRHLEEAGKRVHMISIDDFFYEQPHAKRLMEEKDGYKKIDFDSIDALDFPLLRASVISLMSNGYAKLPHFDLSTGLRSGVYELTAHDDDDIFLFEGIQTVYPQINALLREYPYYSMFINVQTSLNANEISFEPNRIRLLRRLVRDYYRRSSPPDFTFFAWHSVRENEENNIFPFADACDATMDSLMGYELSMLRPYLEHILPLLPVTNASYAVAEGILRDVKEIQPLSEILLPKDSLYREFVGRVGVSH